MQAAIAARRWIGGLGLGLALGAAGCDDGHHPDGYAKGSVHGAALKVQAEPCRTCHGADLTGAGDAPSCDACHTPEQPQAWREDCTFCHGGDLDDTGAPPRDLDGASMDISFPAHPVHVGTELAKAIACTECHVQPDNVLSTGHVFDDTPGAVEVDFSGGRAPAATYDGAGCSNNYCHGNGQGANGQIAKDADPRTCISCHAGVGSSFIDLATMSGEHRRHIQEGLTCESCHASVAVNGTTLLDAALHIDGEVAVELKDPAMAISNGRCTGLCHGENHVSERW